jgi:hypothetical protein
VSYLSFFLALLYAYTSYYSLLLVTNLPQKTREAEPKLVYQTEPVTSLKTEPVLPDFDPSLEVPADDALWTEYLKAVEEINKEIQSTNADLINFPGKDVIVTTLGTGSALPSKYRNGNWTCI